jgi:RNA polymerase sigma-70 factor, ECF subfamily
MAFRGELADFGAFYERTYQGTFRTVLGIVRDPAVAAELTQEAFTTAFRERDGFRGDAPAGAWLHRIAVRAALSALRRRRMAGPREIAVSVDPTGQDRTTHEGQVADRLAIFAALDALAPNQRAAVVLRYYHDYDYATIALILDTSPGNVGSLLTRSLDRLREILGPDALPPVTAVTPGATEARHDR